MLSPSPVCLPFKARTKLAKRSRSVVPARWLQRLACMCKRLATAYFGALNAAISHTPTLRSVAQTLHAASTNSNGRQSLQFSFATKLLHMTNQQLPIYSSEVAAFYFFQEPE